jgi:glycerol-3-phosphate dehydrogenase
MTRGVRPLLSTVEGERFDVVIVGGGIVGCCALWECARRGVRALLVEQNRFGCGTSAASHRIVHGGLRYLQTLDLERARASAREQAWFVRTFPGLVRRLPCAVRLDGRGLRRGSAFAAARVAYAAITAGCSAQGRVAPVPEACVPGPGRGPVGRWNDAVIVSHNRVIAALVRTARARGCSAFEGAAVASIEQRGGRVRGVVVREGSVERRLMCDRVVVACGAGLGCLPGLGGARPEAVGLVNVMIDAPPACDGGVAVYPDGKGPAAFVVPRQGRVMIGTAEFDAARADRAAAVREAADGLVERVGAAWPDPTVSGRVLAIDAGLVPAERDALGRLALSERALVAAGPKDDLPEGVVIAAGEKYTTARATAERALRCVLGGWPRAAGGGIVAAGVPEGWASSAVGVAEFSGGGPAAAGAVRALLAEEGVEDAADLISFRTEWAERPDLAEENAAFVCRALEMSPARTSECVERVGARVARRRSGMAWLEGEALGGRAWCDDAGLAASGGAG